MASRSSASLRSFSSFFLGIVQVSQSFFLVLGGLVTLVLVQLLLSLAHLARGIGGGSTGTIGTQLGQPLQLPLELLLDLRLVLCQLLELVAPFLSIGVLFGVAGGLEVLRLSFAESRSSDSAFFSSFTRRESSRSRRFWTASTSSRNSWRALSCWARA